MHKSSRKLSVGYLAFAVKIINSYINLIGRSEGRKRLGMPRHRTKHNVKRDLKEMRDNVK
jgi:hypothetical protein